MKLTFPFTRKLLATLLSVLTLFETPGVWGQNNELLQKYYQDIITNLERNLADAKASGIPFQEVDVLRTAGIAYQFSGNPQKALELYQQAFRIGVEIKDYGRVRDVLTMMGNAYSKQGDYQGIRFFETQLQQAKTQGDRSLELILLKSLAMAYLANTEYIKSATALETYLDLLPEPREPQEQVTTLGLLASAYGALRETEKLHSTLDRMVAVAKQSGNSQLENAALSQQSMWAQSLGNQQTAISTQEQALQLARKNQDTQSEVLALIQLAHLYAQQNKPQQTITTLEESLAISRTLQNPFTNKFNQSFSLDYLSRAHAQLGNYQKALDLQQESLKLHRELAQMNPSSSRMSEAFALEHLGLIQFRLKQFTEAEKTFQSSLRLHESIRNQTIETNNINFLAASRDDLNLNLRESQADIYRLLQQIAIEKNQPGKALELAEEGRARAFVDLLTMNLSPETKPQTLNSTPSLSQFQAIAKKNQTTLITYSIIYNRPKISWVIFGNEPPREIALYIWVIQPNGNVHFKSINLPESIPIPLHDLLVATRETVTTGRRGIMFNEDLQAVERATEQINRTSKRVSPLRQLYDILILPIENLLPTDPKAHITIIPQESLFMIPFAALRNSDGKFLIDQHTLVTAPSIQVLELTRQQKQQLAQNPAPNPIFVVGNPQMPKFQIRLGETPIQLSSLPGAELEAKAIAQLFNVQPLTGAQATETTVIEKMPQARIIHLATHGLLDNIMGFQSSLSFTPDGKTDGFLTAREILALKLNAELVVLSACDTGRGRISGDGVIGLSRSFIAAGVPSALVTLWKVPDEPTAALMKAFYQNLRSTPDRALALRQAMLETKEKYPSPRDWAAFTLIGETH